MRSGRNTCAVYNSVCIVVYLITAWFIFRTKCLFFSQSYQYTFSKRAEVWIEAEMPSCLSARVFAFLYLSVLWNIKILESKVEWTSLTPCYCLFWTRQNQSLRKLIFCLKMHIWHDSLLFISTSCNGLYILKCSNRSTEIQN